MVVKKSSLHTFIINYSFISSGNVANKKISSHTLQENSWQTKLFWGKTSALKNGKENVHTVLTNPRLICVLRDGEKARGPSRFFRVWVSAHALLVGNENHREALNDVVKEVTNIFELVRALFSVIYSFLWKWLFATNYADFVEAIFSHFLSVHIIFE